MSFNTLNESTQRRLALLIHHSSNSREELCKKLVAEIPSNSPSPDRPSSADKENQVSKQRKKLNSSLQADNKWATAEEFLSHAATHDSKSQLWEVREELRQMWGVSDRIHPFFTSPKLTGERRSDGKSKKTPLVPYTPSSVGGSPVAALSDEEEMMLKRHGFKQINVLVRRINSPDPWHLASNWEDFQLSDGSPLNSKKTKKGKPKARRRQSVVTGKYVRRRSRDSQSASVSSSRASKEEERASSTKQQSTASTKPSGKQKSLNSFFPSTIPPKRPELTPAATSAASSVSTSLPLSAGHEQLRRQQLRIAAKKIQKAVSNFSPRQVNKFARQAVRELRKGLTTPNSNYSLPSASVLEIEPFIHHILQNELTKKKEATSSSKQQPIDTEPAVENNEGGEKEPVRKRRKAVHLGSGGDESYKFERLLNQFLSGKLEDLVSDPLPLPILPPVPLIAAPAQSEPSASSSTTSSADSNTSDYTLFTQCLVFTEWFHTFSDLLGLTYICSATQLLKAVHSEEGRDSYHQCTGRLLKTLITFFISKTDVGKQWSKKNKLVKSAAEAELLGARRGVSYPNAFKFAKLLLGAGDEEDSSAVPDPRVEEEESRTEDEDQLLIKALREVTNYWELAPNHQLNILFNLMETICDSEIYFNYVGESRGDKGKVVEERRAKEAEISTFRAELADLEANMAETTNGEEYSTHRTRIRTREESRELDRRKRELAEKQEGLLELEQHSQQLDQVLKDLKGGVSKLRVQAIGVDRYHRKYWFFHNSPNKGIFVEDNGYEQSTEAMEVVRREMGFVERLQFDLDGWSLMETSATSLPTRWLLLSKKSEYLSLMASLTTRGVREEQLKRKLRAIEEHVLATLEDDMSTTQEQQKAANGSGESEMPSSTSGIAAALQSAGGDDDAMLEDEEEESADDAESMEESVPNSGLVEFSDG